MEYLEYAEEDEDDNLFGSDKDDNATAGPSSLPTFNPAKPLSSTAQSLVGPSAGSGTLKGKERAHARDPQDRLDELRFIRMYKSPPHTGKGARSLKHITQDVLKSNAARIWDVGEMEYRLVAFMVNEMPMDQLAEIEANSHQLRKETDWLWEFHLLKDHPMYYDRCRERRGEVRTTGWRRMYKKALEDQEQRKTNAVDKLAQRYKELEDQKQARKVVFVDKMTAPTRGKAARGRQGGMVIVKAGQARQQPSTTAAASRGIFGKAKAEAQRAKVALTHASGKFDPVAANRLAVPARPRPTTASSSVSLFSVTQPVVSSTTSGPRIPAPRSVAGGTKRPRETSPIIPLPGARPLAQSRTSLPADIRPTSEPTTHSQDRFKVDSNRFESIKRPRVENFEPPRAPTASFRFGNEQSKTISPGKPSFPKPLNPAEEAARLNSVLFVKKKARPTK